MEDVGEVGYENPPKIIKYVRRADRTPEKNFHELSEEEKKHVCFSRTAVNRVRGKITRLEDEIDKRDQEIDKEKVLRQQAETKLQSRMTDMYNNPGVNQELRDRLPRANKSDPFKREELSETDMSSIEEQILPEETEGEEETSGSRPRMGSPEMNNNDGGASEYIRNSSAENSAKSAKRNLNFSNDVKSPPKANMETQTGAFERSNTFPFSNLTPPSQGLYGASPYSPFQGSSLMAAFQNPLLRSSLLSPSTLTRHRSSPVLNTGLNLSYPTQSAEQEPLMSSVLTSNTFAPPAAAASSLQREATSLGEAATASGAIGGSLKGHSLLQPSLESGARADGSRNFLSSHTPSMHTSLLPDPFLPSVSPRLQMSSSLHPDQNKQIAILITEIDSQRMEVQKMKKSLADKDLEIGMLKLTLDTHDAEKQVTSSDADKAAGIVEEVYAAQKKRDDATAKRVKVVNEERDDVMARLRELETRLDAQNNRTFLSPSFDDLPLMEEELEMEDGPLLMSPSSAENSPSALFQRVESVKERQREVMKEEMQIVMEQRDIALARCQKLEAELLRYQKESDADGGMDKNLQAKLAAIQQERDMAVAKSKQLDDEIQTIRLYYSLYKSLSCENTLQQQANHAISNYQEELKMSRQEVEQVLHENNKLVQDNSNMKKQLQAFTIDKKQLQQALESVTQEKERFQRLANVLRRKLNSLTDENKEEEKD